MHNLKSFLEKIGEHRLQETEHAKLYIEIERVDELINVAKAARENKIPFYLFGTGSAIKLPEHQLDGVLVKNNCRKFDIFGMSGKMVEGAMGINYKLMYAESGAILNQVVRFSIEEGLSGLEYFLGLPGTIGGAIYTNTRYTPESVYLNDIVEKIRILNKENEIEEVGSDYFISRSSQEFITTDTIILSAVFRLTPEGKTVLWSRANEASQYRVKQLELRK